MTSRPLLRADAGESDDEPRFGLILLLLLILYVLVSGFEADWLPPVFYGLAAAVLLLTRIEGESKRTWLVVAIGLGTTGLAATVVATASPSGALTGIVNIGIALLLLHSCWGLLVRLVTRPVITMQTVFGAIDVYVLIGLAFAFAYGGIQSWTGEPFFRGDVEGTRNIFSYFSFVSLTTLGYGDYTPGTNLGRSLAVVEVLIGQILLVTVIARLVALLNVNRPASSDD